MRCLSNVLVVLASGTACASQQWTVVVLHPPGARWSDCFALNGTHQGGEVVIPEPTPHVQAGLWQGSPQSWVILSEPPDSAVLRGMDAIRQVGQFFGPCIWEGTAKSRVSLQPTIPGSGGASAIRGNMQTGGFSNVTDGRAALWRGTPESYINLHPPGAIRSSANSTDGILQGGWSDWPIGTFHRTRATIWDGAAASYTLLGPEDRPSRIDGMAPGVQVGQVSFTGQGARAALWRGTPESYTDMHPSWIPGPTLLLGTTGRVHVGRMADSGAARAAVNFGTPEAWLSLHQFLPPGFGSFSAARAVHQEGNTLYICGYAVSNATSDNQAILWIGSVPPQYCYANCDQSTTPPYLNIDDFLCFINSFAAAQGLSYLEQLGHRANCDQSTVAPVLNIDDFTCFVNAFALGCD